ncbi:leucine-rich repeat and IQ domain-containing protein 4-like [Anopheles moucheti]|uniref:leucine-rich repeat and IQ domain-containing protein 4-like n=1 Tax=Anopheles moucheti TaxID=186751 RepID=UPI0022EFE119|nr:leucine-rich repeat and IQ domain-containing protein 4-like [Anopheles moucheti]
MATTEYRWFVLPKEPVKSTTRLPYSLVKDLYKNSNRRQYMCRERNLQYDCIFRNVLIDRGSTEVRFGYEDIAINKQKNITFKNSVIRQLPETLFGSFMQAEMINITSLQIEEIDQFALTNGNIRELYMGYNFIQELPKVVFRNMRFLSVLVMDGNNLTSLPEGMLFCTPNLTVLSIANNKLQRIEDNTFKKNKALQFLTVSGNKLTHINLSLIPSLFHGNVSSNLLTTLSVPEAVIVLDASHNRIVTVTGPNNEELAILRLQHNSLTDTAWLRHYSGLVDIDLSYNELEEIAYHHFSNMYRLERLYLSNNRLVALKLGLAPIRTLQILDILDVRHNHLLHVERNVNQFNTLEELYLDHNAIVTLKLRPNNALQNLTLSHNDWDCKNLDELFQNVSESVINDRDRFCKADYQLKQGICCKESDKPQLDRLLQQIRLTIDAEKQQRAEGCCSASDIINSVRKLTDFITQEGILVQSNPQLQTEINLLKADVQLLTYQQSQHEQLLELLHTEVDNTLRRYRVTKQGLVHPSENLRKAFEHLNLRRTVMEGETKKRQSEANIKEQEVASLEQVNVNLEYLLEMKESITREINKETKYQTGKVHRLEAKRNSNAPARQITK